MMLDRVKGAAIRNFINRALVNEATRTMAAKNTSKSSAKTAAGTQKNAAPAKAASKSAAKASKTTSSAKKESAPPRAEKAEAQAPQKLSQKNAAKTQSMTSKKSEPQAEAPQAAEAPKAAPAKAPVKKASASKQTAVKFPKGIFSPATGTATTDPFPPKDLDKFRTLIQELRMENQEELEVLTEQLREMTSSENVDDNSAYSLHMAEQGTDAMEREKTFLQAQRTSDYIKKLDEALRRIQDGSFGICRICGLRLDNKRMMAVPVTQVCTFYKNASKPCEPGRIQLDATGGADEENEG